MLILSFLTPVWNWLLTYLCILWPSIKMSEPDSSSVFSGNVENGTFLELFPTSLSTSVDPSSGHLSNVYIYVSIFLSLLAFLLLLLIIALQRLKNIISSSSSYPEYPSDAGSSFTNLEVCSISSQRSTFSNLSSWRRWKNSWMLQQPRFSLAGSVTWTSCFMKEITPFFSNQLDLFLLLHPSFLVPFMMLFICECRSWCWLRNVCKHRGAEFHTNHLTNRSRPLQGESVHFTLLDTWGRTHLRQPHSGCWIWTLVLHFSYKTVKPNELAETGKIKSELLRRYSPYLKDKMETPN